MKKPSVSSQIAVFIWPLVILAALLDFVFGDILAAASPFLPAEDGVSPALAEDVVPFLANLCLVTVGIALVFQTGALVRLGTGAGRRIAYRGLAVLVLAFLGVSVIQTLTHSKWLMATQNGIFVCSLMILIGLVACAHLPIRRRLPLVALSLGLAMPHLWRLSIEIQGDVVRGQPLLSGLRTAGDLLIPVSGAALLAVPSALWRRRRLLVAAAVPAALLLVALLLRFSLSRKLLGDVTDLHLTTLPEWGTTIVLPMALMAAARLALGAILHDEAVGLALAVLLLVLAGFLPLGVEDMATSILALTLLAAWADGKADSKADLAALV